MRYFALLSALLLTMGCDSAFHGGGAFSGGKKGFKGPGGGNPFGGGSGDGTNGGGSGYRGGPNGGGLGGPNGGLNQDGGVITTNFLPMTLTVFRADTSGQDIHDHSDVSLKYSVVGSNQVETGTINHAQKTITIPRACPRSGRVDATISFVFGGQEVQPNKNTNAGGPIGQRIDSRNIVVAFEKEAVNNPEETAYHNNDDFVVLFNCATADIGIQNLCIDTRIPGSTIQNSDLVTDDDTHTGDEMGRQCNGT